MGSMLILHTVPLITKQLNYNQNQLPCMNFYYYLKNRIHSYYNLNKLSYLKNYLFASVMIFRYDTASQAYIVPLSSDDPANIKLTYFTCR